jgi:hypothetical protein
VAMEDISMAIGEGQSHCRVGRCGSCWLLCVVWMFNGVKIPIGSKIVVNS